MTAQNLTISIGRNVGDTQLSLHDWDGFRDYIDTITDRVIYTEPGAQVVQRGNVRGFWDGQEEESFTVTVAGVDPTRVVYGSDDATVRQWVARLVGNACGFYGQEAIAVTWSTPEFITAAE